MTDEEAERIFEEGIAAGESDWCFGKTPNPYPAGSDQADTWACAYRNAYALANGK